MTPSECRACIMQSYSGLLLRAGKEGLDANEIKKVVEDQAKLAAVHCGIKDQWEQFMPAVFRKKVA